MNALGAVSAHDEVTAGATPTSAPSRSAFIGRECARDLANSWSLRMEAIPSETSGRRSSSAMEALTLSLKLVPELVPSALRDRPRGA